MLFLHGNVSSSLFWQLTMLHMPHPYQPIAMDMRGFGDTDTAPVDATRGLRDFSDDVAALAVLDQYRAAGGHYTELVLPEAGHAAFLDEPKAFQAALLAFLGSSQ